MPRTTRTFIALPVPAAIRSKLEGLRLSLGPELQRARWGGPDGFRLTLAFLGDVADTDLNAVCLAVAEVVRDRPRFDLTVRGLGTFPDPSRPRVLWAGIAGDLDALTSLQKSVF